MGNSQYRRQQHIITHTTVISIAYLASPDLSGSLGIIIYFLRRKYPAGKAAKRLSTKLLKSQRIRLTLGTPAPLAVKSPL